VSVSRREVIVAGGCVVLASVADLPAFAAVSGQRLLTDDPDAAAAGGAVLLPAGRFVDDALIAGLPAGKYLAHLSPANSMLLLEVLRTRRTDTTEDDAGDLHFTIGRYA